MKLFIKLFAGFIIGLMLLAMIGAITLRESLGGQYRFDYRSPSHPDCRVEIYEYPGMVGNPSFALFVVDSGVRKYLGDLGVDTTSVWTENLLWSNDGAAIVCRDKNYRAAYVFGEGKTHIRDESRGANDLTSLMLMHGGEGLPFFLTRKIAVLSFGVILCLLKIIEARKTGSRCFPLASRIIP